MLRLRGILFLLVIVVVASAVDAAPNPDPDPAAQPDPFFFGGWGGGFGRRWGYEGGWGRRGWGWGWGWGWGPYGPYGPYGGYPYYAYDGLAGSIRVQFEPKTAEVYVDGYYAGVVDQFDGFFQAMRIEPGGREVVIYQDGFRTFRQRIYVRPYDTYRLKGVLQPLAAGEPNDQRPAPAAPVEREPEGWSGAGEPEVAVEPEAVPPAEPRPSGDVRAPAPGNFGLVAVRVQPADADVLIDGEPWKGSPGSDRLVVHLKPGFHRVEARKDGYDPFVTTVEIKKGETTVLNVSLGRVGGV